MATWKQMARVCAGVGILSVLVSGAAYAQSTYMATLSHVAQAIDPVGRTVFTMMANGDLQGALTLVLERSTDGNVIRGEWAITVSYTEVYALPPSPDGDEDGHGERLVQRGVLKGAVIGGRAASNGAGAITAVTGIRLAITGGTLEYSATTTGGGLIDGTNLSDAAMSGGSIMLSF